jgi:hypothetical protein
MNWSNFLKEGDEAVEKVYRGLIRRGINAGKSILTEFNTDEDIPVYDSSGNKIFWISVKSVGRKIVDPKNPPGNRQGYLCGEVESKQWVNPSSVIIWLCMSTNVSWGAITPKRLSTKWHIFPDRYGKIRDERKSYLTGQNEYMYPSWRVPLDCIITKDEVIAYIQSLCTELGCE